MAVMISLGFLIAWTPYVAVSFWSMHNSQKQGHMAPSITLLPCLFAKSATAYNPFIYFIFQRNAGHKLLPFQRLAFSCSDQADSTGEGEKAENSHQRSWLHLFWNWDQWNLRRFRWRSVSERECSFGLMYLHSWSETLPQMWSFSNQIDYGLCCPTDVPSHVNLSHINAHKSDCPSPDLINVFLSMW